MLGVLVGLDREFDALDTPRICAVADIASGTFWLGSITATSASVMPIALEAGQFAYVTTYGYPHPQATQIDASFTAINAGDVCSHIVRGSIFAEFDQPICAASIMCEASGIDIATLDVKV
jgi:IMP cyclohydrolase